MNLAEIAGAIYLLVSMLIGLCFLVSFMPEIAEELLSQLRDERNICLQYLMLSFVLAFVIFVIFILSLLWPISWMILSYNRGI